MVWIAILLGPVTWIGAVAVGAYRQFCYWSDRNYHGINTPLVWRNKAFRVSTWIIVAFLALLSSATFTEMLRWVAPQWVAVFSFGVSLALRWVASMILAATSLRRSAVRLGLTLEANLKRESNA